MNLENNSFLIFKPDHKFHITPNRIVYTLVLATFIPAAIELIIVGQDNFSGFGKFLSAFSMSILIVANVYKLVKTDNREPLDGEVLSGLRFYMDVIETDVHSHPIEKIKKIEISSEDYDGRVLYSGKGNFNGSLSNGVHNRLALFFNDGKIMEILFHQAYEYEIRKIKAYLIHYHLQGKIHFLHLIDKLGITDYDEIQEFKKQIYKVSESENPPN